MLKQRLFYFGFRQPNKSATYPLCSERRTPAREARERHPYRTRTADAHILRNRLVCRSPHVCPDLLAVRKERRRTFPEHVLLRAELRDPRGGNPQSEPRTSPPFADSYRRPTSVARSRRDARGSRLRERDQCDRCNIADALRPGLGRGRRIQLLPILLHLRGPRRDERLFRG